MPARRDRCEEAVDVTVDGGRVRAPVGRPAPDISARVAGGLLVAVGAANVVFGVLGLLTDVVRLGAAVSGGLLVAGLVTASAGVLVWRGSRVTTVVALAVLGLLLPVQLGELAGAAGDETSVPRLVVLACLVVALAVAARRGRHPRTG
jgi:hypothetical protein